MKKLYYPNNYLNYNFLKYYCNKEIKMADYTLINTSTHSSKGGHQIHNPHSSSSRGDNRVQTANIGDVTIAQDFLNSQLESQDIEMPLESFRSYNISKPTQKRRNDQFNRQNFTGRLDYNKKDIVKFRPEVIVKRKFVNATDISDQDYFLQSQEIQNNSYYQKQAMMQQLNDPEFPGSSFNSVRKRGNSLAPIEGLTNYTDLKRQSLGLNSTHGESSQANPVDDFNQQTFNISIQEPNRSKSSMHVYKGELSSGFNTLRTIQNTRQRVKQNFQGSLDGVNIMGSSHSSQRNVTAYQNKLRELQNLKANKFEKAIDNIQQAKQDEYTKDKVIPTTLQYFQIAKKREQMASFTAESPSLQDIHQVQKLRDTNLSIQNSMFSSEKGHESHRAAKTSMGFHQPALETPKSNQQHDNQTEQDLEVQRLLSQGFQNTRKRLSDIAKLDLELLDTTKKRSISVLGGRQSNRLAFNNQELQQAKVQSPKVIKNPLQMAAIGQGLASRLQVKEKMAHNYNKDFHKHLQEINKTVSIEEIMNKTQNIPRNDFKSYTDAQNKNILRGEFLSEFQKLNVQIKKGDFISPVPFKINPSQDSKSETRPKYTYEDFLKTESDYEEHMRQRELHRLQNHLEGIGTGKGPIHMLRRAVVSTIDHNKQEESQKETLWNEQSEWYTPNTLPTLNMAKALRTQQFKTVQSDMNRSPLVKNRFIIAQHKKQKKPKNLAARGGPDGDASEESPIPYRIQKHLDIMQVKNANIQKAESLNKMKEKIVEDEMTQISSDIKLNQRKSKRSGIRSIKGLGDLKQGNKSPGKGSPSKYRQQLEEIPYEKSYDSEQSFLDEEEDKEYVDYLILNMPDELQKKLGIYDLDRDLQRSIYVKQKNSELNKNKYMINESPEKFCEYLDQKADERRTIQENMPPALLQFIRKRLIRVLNLRELQAQQGHRDDSCIVCGVKQKIKVYLNAKDKRDVGFTKNPYRDDLLRKQLEYIDVTKGNQVFGDNAQREELCTHFETIDKIQDMEEVFLEAYKVFLGLIPLQPITTKRDTIHNIALHFYHLEGLTEEEKQVYKNPKNFKALLTSPWIRIVKDQGAEELGQDKYDDLRNPEPDEVFRQVQNLKVRKILKQIHQLYLDATDEEAVAQNQDNFKDPNLIKIQEKFTSNQKPFDVENEVKNIKALAKDLRAIFKDLNIKKLVQRAPSRYSNSQSSKGQQFVPTSPNIESVLKANTEAQDYFSLNKTNHNCCHPAELQEESSAAHPSEQQLQYNYHQASLSKDRKLRTFPGLPVPTRLFSDDNPDVFRMSNFKGLEDPNYLAVKQYIQEKRIVAVIMENNQNSDFQLKTVLEGLLHNNFQYFQKFVYTKGQMAKKSIEVFCQILSFQQMSQGQLKQMHSKMGGWISRTNTNTSGQGQVQPSPPLMSKNCSPTATPAIGTRKSSLPSQIIPQPAVNKLQHLILDGIQILIADARLLLEQLCETNLDTLIEVKLKNFNLNEDKTVGHLCTFLRQQTNLSILDLSYTSLRATHLLTLSDFFVESEMAQNFVSLNLSFNNAISTNLELQKQLTQSFCILIQTCEKIKYLYMSNMQMPDDMVLQISQKVVDSSQTLQIFHITHNSPSLPASESISSENRKDILKTFGLKFISSQKSLDHPSQHFNVRSHQDQFDKSKQEDLIEYLINQKISRDSRKPVDAKVFDAPRATLKFFRNLARNEQIFTIPGGFDQGRGLKHSLNFNWQVQEGGKCFKEHQFPPVLILYDRRAGVEGTNTGWEEIPKDDALLKRIHYSHYDYGDMPFICYDGVVSPLIHAQMFTILAALNNSELFEETVPKGKEALVKFVRSLQKGYCNLIQTRKGAQRNIPEVSQALEEQFQVISQKSEGWIEYIEQNLMDFGTGYFNQVICAPTKISENKKPGQMCQDYFVYSTFIEPMAKQKTFILFDPKTDKMFKNKSIIQPQTAHFQQVQVQRLKQPSKQIQRIDGGLVFQSFKVDKRLKFRDEVFDLLDTQELWVSKIDSETRQIIAKFYRPLIDLQSYCLVQSMGQAITEIKLPDKKSKKMTGDQTQSNSKGSIHEESKSVVEVSPFISEFNTALLADGKEEQEKSEIQNRADNLRFFDLEDASKFDNLPTFIRCLLVVFNKQPKKMFQFIVDYLLPMYKSQMQTPKEQLICSSPLSQEIREASLVPLKYLFYLDLNLAGKIDFAFLQRVFMGAEGLNWAATCFKNKKTVSYNTDQAILDCIAICKLRQNERITRQNLEGITLDFDEFLMFLCVIIQFMKNNQVCPKSWLEQNLEQIVPSIVNKIVFQVFKIKKPKVKKAAAGDDLGDVFTGGQEQIADEEIVDSSDEDF